MKKRERIEVIVNHNDEEVVRYEPQKRDIGDGWFSLTVNFRYRPGDRSIEDLGIWAQGKRWWEFWK